VALPSDEFVKAWDAYTDEHFPYTNAVGNSRKVVDEAFELLADPDDELELADVMLTLLHHAKLTGVDIAAACDKKMEILRTRRWTVDDRGVYSHVK
jgi:NTP pyrophosphatase (non-canonical NTP hydrolase)